MRVLVTGANGFIGRALVRRLLAGSIADAGVLEQALAAPVDAVFHLACVPGGAAEREPVLARRVNLDATARPLDLPAAQGGAPRLVFASTVAVYGEPLLTVVDEDTPAMPVMSYGAHKLATEVLVADAARRGQATVPGWSRPS